MRRAISDPSVSRIAAALPQRGQTSDVSGPSTQRPLQSSNAGSGFTFPRSLTNSGKWFAVLFTGL